MFRLGHRLYKFEKLCSETAIGRLYAHAAPGDPDAPQAQLVYPLRAVWRLNSARRPSIDCPQFLISVPKKRLRHAVDRVAMRRRIREAYRLNRSLLPPSLPLDIAFGYVGNGLCDYARIESAMQRLLTRIAALYAPEAEHTSDTDTPPLD